jgi:hypothetical protein
MWWMQGHLVKVSSIGEFPNVTPIPTFWLQPPPPNQVLERIFSKLLRLTRPFPMANTCCTGSFNRKHLVSRGRFPSTPESLCTSLHTQPAALFYFIGVVFTLLPTNNTALSIYFCYFVPCLHQELFEPMNAISGSVDLLIRFKFDALDYWNPCGLSKSMAYHYGVDIPKREMILPKKEVPSQSKKKEIFTASCEQNHKFPTEVQQF